MKFSKEDLEIIKNALWDRKNRIYRDIELYKKSENTEAVKDCFAEYKKANKLYEMVTAMWREKEIYGDIEDNHAEVVYRFLGDVLSKADDDVYVVVDMPESFDGIEPNETLPMTYAWYDELNNTIRISFEEK